jgi:DNA-binding MarR family transcriptional regulator
MDCCNSDSLYHIFSHIIRLHYHRAHTLLDGIGIYPGQPPMLIVLYKKNGQSQKELADKLNIKPATVTVMLNRMEKAELVERRQDTDDQRVSRVYLTQKGRESYKKVIEVIRTMESECFNNFTEEEKALLRKLLMQMRNNLLKVCDDKPDF